MERKIPQAHTITSLDEAIVALVDRLAREFVELPIAHYSDLEDDELSMLVHDAMLTVIAEDHVMIDFPTELELMGDPDDHDLVIEAAWKLAMVLGPILELQQMNAEHEEFERARRHEHLAVETVGHVHRNEPGSVPVVDMRAVKFVCVNSPGWHGLGR